MNGVLGAPDLGKTDEHIYYCPFCHHHKKKMNVNIDNQKWHCWVCDAKGQKIYNLLKRLNVDKSVLTTINKIYGENTKYTKKQEEVKYELFLPKEFISLVKKPSGFMPHWNHAKNYIKSRGITDEDIVKYNIGFCKDGLYAGRVIIPSYDGSGQLNYFIARTIYDNEKYPYKNPPISKDVVALGNHINWDEPITLVEGIFDAIAVKRNVIPLFGKFIPKSLISTIFLKKVKHINIMLDMDAQEQALKYTTFFNNQQINTKNIIPTSKDAGEMGFSTVNQIIKTSKETKYGDIISQKLKNI